MGDNPDIEEMGRSRSGSARIRTRRSRSRSKTGGASSTIKRSKSPRNKEIPPERKFYDDSVSYLKPSSNMRRVHSEQVNNNNNTITTTTTNNNNNHSIKRVSS